jgi:hypothetical protein
MSRRVLPQHIKKHRNYARNWKNARRIDGTFKKSRRGKYNAQGREVDGHWFPSKAEADRYEQLREMVRTDRIFDLELQPEFRLVVNNKLVCIYRADFRYKKRTVGMGYKTVIEDVKGMRTKEFALKMKLLAAVHPEVNVIEVPVDKKHGVQRLRFLTGDEIFANPPGVNDEET